MDFKPLLRLFGIGMVMGAAEIVPGVSGGSIAFITGIYERLLNAIKHFTPMLLLKLKNDGIKATWVTVDANFLLTLVSGMAVSVVLLASGLHYLLENQPVMIWSFFFGLVLLSAWIVLRRITRFGLDIGFAIGVGIAFGYIITSAVPLNLSPTPLNLFFGGVIAISAWVLPGISGSFMLLILGLYRFVIEAISELNLMLLVSFAAGCGIGIVAFSHFLSRLLARYQNETLAVLTGVMLGSLGKIWPWRHVSSYQIKADGSHTPLVETPVLPDVYMDLTGADADIGLAIAGFVLGAVAVFGLHLLARQNTASR
jgi:putative membrane protein